MLDPALGARVEVLAVVEGDSDYPFDLGSADGERGAEPRVEKVFGYPPFSEMGDLQRREFHEALLEADSFEDLPGGVAGGDPGG